mmetsp:Transcript_24190/g.41081  ORF Transcript_24190/g.41081 Transcript_24190/m.41081 type:complete len:200 (-) Transcript_24190:1181-1780(-)
MSLMKAACSASNCFNFSCSDFSLLAPDCSSSSKRFCKAAFSSRCLASAFSIADWCCTFFSSSAFLWSASIFAISFRRSFISFITFSASFDEFFCTSFSCWFREAISSSIDLTLLLFLAANSCAIESFFAISDFNPFTVSVNFATSFRSDVASLSESANCFLSLPSASTPILLRRRSSSCSCFMASSISATLLDKDDTSP